MVKKGDVSGFGVMRSRQVRNKSLRERCARPIRLSGLLSVPDPQAVINMKIFDKLPRSIQAALDRCDFYFSVTKVHAYFLRNGEARTLKNIQLSVADERRRFAELRDKALAAAQASFNRRKNIY